MKEKLVQLRILIKGLILLITLYSLFGAWTATICTATSKYLQAKWRLPSPVVSK